MSMNTTTNGPPIDLEAIQSHIDEDDDGTGYHDCSTCIGNQVALLAELKRLRERSEEW